MLLAVDREDNNHCGARSLLGCSWSHCNVFVNLGIESDLYMKGLRNAVYTWIGITMTLNASCSRVPGSVKHILCDLV